MKFKLGLIWRILIAIVLAIGLGLLLPAIHEGFAHWFVRLAATFNMLFGGFLNFIVPLIIIAFIAPSIAKLGKGSGKLLGLSAAFAYGSTIIAGLLAYFTATALLPNFIHQSTDTSVAEGARAAGVAFLKWKWTRLWESCLLFSSRSYWGLVWRPSMGRRCCLSSMN